MRVMKQDKESKPIRTTEQATFVNLLQTHRYLVAGLNVALKSVGLSEPQFNVLRILRGAGDDGLPCQGIAARMLTRVPDVTRLIDRLEASGLVGRERSETDRRVVIVKIAADGMDLLRKLYTPVLEIHKRQFGLLTSMELYELNRLLVKVRRSSELMESSEDGMRSTT